MSCAETLFFQAFSCTDSCSVRIARTSIADLSWSPNRSMCWFPWFCGGFVAQSCKVAKLFAKHFKLIEQQTLLTKRAPAIAVGTPHRLHQVKSATTRDHRPASDHSYSYLMARSLCEADRACILPKKALQSLPLPPLSLLARS